MRYSVDGFLEGNPQDRLIVTGGWSKHYPWALQSIKEAIMSAMQLAYQKDPCMTKVRVFKVELGPWEA